MADELTLYPVTEFVEELKHRNITFVLAWVDHLQFNKQNTQEIVWGIDHDGVLPLKKVLLEMLATNLQQLTIIKTSPGNTEA